MATSCPLCKKRVPDGVQECPNCGNFIDRGDAFVQIAPTGTYGERSPSPAVDEHGFAREEASPDRGFATIGVGSSERPSGTFIPVGPLQRRRSFLPALFALLVFGGIAAVIFFARDVIDSAVQGVTEGIEEIGGPGVQGGPSTEGALPRGSLDTVQALAKDLRAAGVTCRNVTVNAANDFTSTGTCQSSDTFPLTILMFFDRASLDATERSLRGGSASYVHDANWFIITPTNAVARDIRKAIGGKIHKGAF